MDHTLRAISLKIAAADTRTYFVRVVRKLGPINIPLGKTTELTVAEARKKAIAEQAASRIAKVVGYTVNFAAVTNEADDTR